MRQIRWTLAVAVWLFAWVSFSFLVALLTGGHGFRAATRTLAFEIAPMRDALYVATEYFAPTQPTLRYVWSPSGLESWQYLIRAAGGDEWPDRAGFQRC